jgi:Family of unknown function (DUF6444)
LNQSAMVTVPCEVTVAAGVFAPGHLGELTRYLPENAVLRAELEAQLERYRRLELRVTELERRLGPDSTTSGTPPSKDPIGARERRKAERKTRQSSEPERRADRRRGGQPGHPGAGPSRDPDPEEREEAPPPAECSRCGTALDPARRTGTRWSQVRDVKITTFVTEYPAAAADLPVLREGQRRAGNPRGRIRAASPTARASTPRRCC